MARRHHDLDPHPIAADALDEGLQGQHADDDMQRSGVDAAEAADHQGQRNNRKG